MTAKNPQEELILFLEANPKYYPIMKSEIFIKILEWISERARTMPDIGSQFVNIEKEDLELILNSLLALGIVSKTQTVTQVIYYLSDEGKMLLEKSRKAGKSLKIA